jgi:hypothetical protein
MTAPDNQPRTLRLTMACTPYEVTVQPCPMSALVAGEHIVGPDGTSLLEVWTSCGEHEHGWL